MLAESFTAEDKRTAVKYFYGVAGVFNPISSHSAFILVDHWTGSGVLRQAVELSSGKGWVERAPWVVCLFYKLSGSIVLSYLFLFKQITGMIQSCLDFPLVLRYYESASEILKFALN